MAYYSSLGRQFLSSIFVISIKDCNIDPEGLAGNLKRSFSGPETVLLALDLLARCHWLMTYLSKASL
ncbi:hypothetical protein TELCIR_00752 [Teladorsagia circumcincta]|uniref:Uncharacterized protein n=1 Tax=Teladorsagia circumcincta TaxID=45464 RepID=A0A2G9V3V3_TELCI|nr:hypothetical protein TELCIR_00752 [Teladorsagia circumcincta]